MPKVARPVAAYPRPEQILRTIQTARESGFNVCQVEVCRDGTIRLSDDSSAPAQSMFDVWNKADKL